MKAVRFDSFGDSSVLYVGDDSIPVPAEGELLVRVYAAALNRADILQREGKYPPPFGESPILGLELAGEVVDTGAGVSSWKPGDRVCGLVGGGAYAEYAILRADMALPMFDDWSWEQAAIVPEAFLTAWQSLKWIANTQPGEQVLIHAGASGVGTAAIQLARALGAIAWVTASSSKHDFCRSLGAAGCIDYRTEDFAEVLNTLDYQGADVIIDCIGGPYLSKNVGALRLDGRMVILAMMGGLQGELDFRPVLSKRLRIQGSTLRNRTTDYKSALTADLYRFAWPLFQNGQLRPVLDRSFLLDQVGEAHQYMEANRNQGKIALRIP